jgi:transposase
VGKTKRGKGTKIMAVADRSGLPIAISVGSASPHEVTLVETTLAARFTEQPPERLIGDKAYDSDPLDERLNEQGIQMIAPHKSNRIKAKTQDGRPLRRYRKRWKIERLFAWLQNFRRILVRHDRILSNYLGFVQLGCMIILLRSCF